MTVRDPVGATPPAEAGARARLPVPIVRKRMLALVATMSALTACATAPQPGKARELTPAERDSLSNG